MSETASPLRVHYSSRSREWATPWEFYAELDAEFDFTLDPCATADNAKCPKFYTREQDGLAQSWAGERVFMNPPYGKGIAKWVRKAAESVVHRAAEGMQGASVVVCLLPARTDTAWFHDYIYDKADEIRFIRGRIKFSESQNSAPFPSMVVVFRAAIVLGAA